MNVVLSNRLEMSLGSVSKCRSYRLETRLGGKARRPAVTQLNRVQPKSLQSSGSHSVNRQGLPLRQRASSAGSLPSPHTARDGFVVRHPKRRTAQNIPRLCRKTVSAASSLWVLRCPSSDLKQSLEGSYLASRALSCGMPW